MKYLKSLLLLIFLLGSLSAQSFVGKINKFPQMRAKVDTVKILALMVEFQADNDPLTFGNGKFETIFSEDYGTEILDPLPHNQEYFNDHLLFSKNYYEKVSNNNLTVTYIVDKEIITVSKTMREYSPPNKSDDLSSLAELCKEVWKLADQKGTINFSEYNLFSIFHAGVGRDVSLPGSIGNEKDLPSVYMNLKSFKKYFGEDFEGFSVNGGSYKISNSMILPETESRELTNILGKTLLELSINGLLVGSIASHLGLPDLFNTETGLSAIGRFGLMDGQALFTYGGTFPPEPSPWEKMYLGWITPTEAGFGNDFVNLKNPKTANLGDTTYLKLKINSDEYFLVENRQRDAFKDGATLTYKVDGEIKTKTFEKDTTGFYSFNVDSLNGVVIDVDEFDWAMPGNGIVIWHIDEKIIRDKFATNDINNDLFKRGVNVEEADGIQDIGVQFNTIFGDVVVGEGSDLDYWYKGNKSELYTNKFSADSKPNTNTNNGAKSLLSISNFSSKANSMSFNYSYNNEDVKLLTVFNAIETADDFSAINIGNESIFYSLSNKTLRRFDSNGNLLNELANFSNQKPICFYDEDNKAEYSIGVIDSKVNVLETINGASRIVTKDIGTKITSVPVFASLNAQLKTYDFFVGTESGSLFKIEFNANPLASPLIPIYEKEIKKLNEPIKFIAYGNGSLAFSGDSKVVLNDNSEILTTNKIIQLVLNKKSSNNSEVIVLLDNNEFGVVNNNGFSSIKTSVNSNINNFSMGDLFQDGTNYIVFNSGDELHAINTQGYEADNFPFLIENSFISQPLLIDINNDGFGDIISFDDVGNIYGISGYDGKSLMNFPISSGDNVSATGKLLVYNNFSSLSFVTTNNSLISWGISSTNSNTPIWSGEFNDSKNSSFIGEPGVINKNSNFFPVDRAYNWPNPVYENETYFRYFVGKDSKVEINIFDLAGDFVAKLSDNAIGGVDNETVWKVSNIQSGVYFANLKVTASTGESNTKVIKVVVVK